MRKRQPTCPRWQQCVSEYLAYLERKGNRTIADTRQKLGWTVIHMGNKYLSTIDRHTLDDLFTTRRRLGKKGGGQVTGATLNRWWAAVSGCLRYAVRMGYIDRAPVWDGKVPEPRGRARVVRWLTQEQARDLLAALPRHLRPVVRFALATGLRKQNILKLRWSQIDLGRRWLAISAKEMKAKRNLGLPLSDEAITVLQEMRGVHPEWVFTYQRTKKYPPQVIGNFKHGTWRRALQQAGIDPAFRFHDLRHTWATWHVQADTPLEVLKELGGWATLEMVLVYAHQSGTRLAKYANNPAIIMHTPQNLQQSN